jgi:hypothetical protein
MLCILLLCLQIAVALLLHVQAEILLLVGTAREATDWRSREQVRLMLRVVLLCSACCCRIS